MNRKHQEVQVWLEKLFAGQPVPSYELNQHTVAILHDLLTKNEAKDRDTQLIIEDHRQKAEEYNAESRRLENILKSINLSSASLSQSGVLSLRTLANLALLLQIKDSSDTSYLLSLQHLHTELSHVSDARQLEQRTIAKLIQKTNTALHKYNSLKRSLESLERDADSHHPDIENKAKQTGFLVSKSKEYRSQVEKYQSQLNKVGVDPSEYHAALVKTAEEFQKLQEEITPLKQKLQTYHSLPPDISLAKVKLEEIRQKVAALEAEISEKINLVHI